MKSQPKGFHGRSGGGDSLSGCRAMWESKRSRQGSPLLRASATLRSASYATLALGSPHLPRMFMGTPTGTGGLCTAAAFSPSSSLTTGMAAAPAAAAPSLTAYSALDGSMHLTGGDTAMCRAR